MYPEVVATRHFVPLFTTSKMMYVATVADRHFSRHGTENSVNRHPIWYRYQSGLLKVFQMCDQTLV